MARPRRLHLAGGYYHVTLRGNGRQPIFFEPTDRQMLDGMVMRAAEATGTQLHAYCWMTNHLHLLVRVSDVPLGRMMLRIASRYARAIHARREKSGHLFERRYFATLVDADRYLLTLLQYIHLNPVRAGLVADPAQYPWSSHGDYLGETQREWVVTRDALALLSPDTTLARERYRQLIAGSSGIAWGAGSLVTHARNCQVLGDDAFLARLTGQVAANGKPQTLDEAIADCCQRFGISADLLTSRARSPQLKRARTWLAQEVAGGRLSSTCELARRLGRSEGAIRYLVNQ